MPDPDLDFKNTRVNLIADIFLQPISPIILPLEYCKSHIEIQIYSVKRLLILEVVIEFSLKYLRVFPVMHL